jgi:hypothetical protein
MESAVVGPRKLRWLKLTIFLIGWAAGALAARPYAGSWNDGSRLATVESLIDHHTLAIDRSIFSVPLERDRRHPPPYGPDDWIANVFGTGDKLLIQGRYYSDKSPVPALPMALAYYVAQHVGGLVAALQVDRFCWSMTTLSSGLAFAIALVALFSLCLEINLSVQLALLVAASMGFSTMALAYAEHVSNHSLLLGVSSVLMLELVRLAQTREAPSPWRVAFAGCLVGMGYAIDLGVGPPLIAAAGVLVAYRLRTWQATAMFVSGMLPVVVLHHVMNYQVGGTLKPANANPEYFLWPGCTFNAQNMTGGWKHPDLLAFCQYSMALLVGKRGFIGHNLPLFLALAAAWPVLRREDKNRPEVVFAMGWTTLTWLMYATNSNNLSGMCCSIRWFLPLLVPAYFVAALQLRDRASWRMPFAILSAWGAELSILMVMVGPWTRHLIPYYWQIQGAAVASVMVWVLLTRRKAVQIRANREIPVEPDRHAA